MQREIKFRAWTTATKSMHYDRPSFIAEYFNKKAGIRSLLPDLDINQFTGVKDKDENDLYEGDIVKFSGGIGKIIFFDPYCAFVVEHQGQYVYEINSGANIEIIGNIYENPELLKPNNN